VEAEIYFKFILSFALIFLVAKIGGQIYGCYLKRSPSQTNRELYDTYTYSAKCIVGA